MVRFLSDNTSRRTPFLSVSMVNYDILKKLKGIFLFVAISTLKCNFDENKKQCLHKSAVFSSIFSTLAIFYYTLYGES